jgi:hypothetical protein
MEMQELVKTPAESAFSLEAFEHAQRVALMLSKSSLIPKEFQNNVQNVMIALEMANRIGASPLMVMQNLYIVHGKPSWSSTFIISAINSCGRFDPLRFDLSGSDMDMKCIAWTTEKGKQERIEGPAVTMQMAKAEGWIDKNGSKWKTMPELMIRYRSAAFFGRLYAPEIMMGMQSKEEVMDVTHVEVSDAKIQEEQNRLTKEAERISLLINDAKTVDELNQIAEFVPESQLDLFTVKMDELKSAGNGKV